MRSHSSASSASMKRDGVFRREATSATLSPAASRAARRRWPQACSLSARLWLGGIIDCFPRLGSSPIAGIPPATPEHNERRRPCHQVFLRSLTPDGSRTPLQGPPPALAAKIPPLPRHDR